jgi:hypothetical protein
MMKKVFHFLHFECKREISVTVVKIVVLNQWPAGMGEISKSRQKSFDSIIFGFISFSVQNYQFDIVYLVMNNCKSRTATYYDIILRYLEKVLFCI